MPVVAVIAAVAVDAGAAAAFAGGLALTSTLGVLTAVTAIGATVGAIGAVTHNKTLSLIGAGLGLVGGIGTLATSAGLFGDAAASGADSIFGSSADAAGSAAGGADTASLASVDDGFGATAATDASGASTAAATTGASTGATTGATSSIDPNLINANSTLPPAGGDAVSAASDAVTGSASATLTGPEQVNALMGPTPWSPPDVTKLLGDPNFDKTMASLGTPTVPLNVTEAPSGGILNWATKDNAHAMLSYGILQGGLNMISGLTSQLTPAQIDALNAQADANRATAALMQRQTTNQGQSLPTASVTGMPTQAAGLINSKPVGTPLITGTPNTGGPFASVPATQRVTGAPV